MSAGLSYIDYDNYTCSFILGWILKDQKMFCFFFFLSLRALCGDDTMKKVPRLFHWVLFHHPQPEMNIWIPKQISPKPDFPDSRFKVTFSWVPWHPIVQNAEIWSSLWFVSFQPQNFGLPTTQHTCCCWTVLHWIVRKEKVLV